MTAAQKKARENFKKAIAYRKKTGCTLKQAFAHVKSGKVGAYKVIQKGESKNAKVTKVLEQKRKKSGKFAGRKRVAGVKKTPVSKHKDTKSHNVNIRVVSGIGKISAGAKKLWIDINKKGYFKFNSEENILKFFYDEAIRKGQFKKAEYLKELLKNINYY